MAKTATIATLVANLEMNSASFRKEMDQARARTKNFTKDLRNTKAANDGFTRSMRGAAQGVAAIDGPLGGVAGRLSAVNGLVTGGGVAWAGLGVAIAGVTAVMYKAVRAGEEMERQQLKIEALLKATDSASGRTAEQLDAQARSVARNTLASVAGIRDAQGVLLTFKSVQTDVFDQAIVLSQDLAAVMGGDAKSAALQLGKALEEPSTGLTALRRAGVSFTEAEKDQIKAMEDAGRAADAQRLILAKLSQQVGGAGTAEAGGLSGQVDTLSQNWQEFLEALAKTEQASKGVGLLSKFVENLRRGVAPTDLEAQELQYKELHKQYVWHQEMLVKAKRDGVQAQIELQGNMVEKLRGQLQEMQSARIEAQKKEHAEAVRAEEAAAAARAQTERERAAAELARQQEAGSAQLVQLDQFLADKQGKLLLEHEQRLEQIEALQLSEQELARRGYESLELLKQEYKIREDERYFLELDEQQRRIDERNQRQLDAERRLQDELTKEQGKQAQQRAKLEAMAALERQRLVGGMWTNLIALTNSKSRKLFELGKAAAIANAVISTYESANKAMTTLPWPLNLAAAAATVAAGLVNVQQIRSQSFNGAGGGGGGASVPSIGSADTGASLASGGSVPSIGADSEREIDRPGTVVNLTVAGDLIGDSAQTIAQQITTLIAEQDLVIIPSGSRQAQELGG